MCVFIMSASLDDRFYHEEAPLLAHLSQRPASVVNNFKHLLQNRLPDQSQILCGASLGRGNESLFAASGSHDQDGRHAHIW